MYSHLYLWANIYKKLSYRLEAGCSSVTFYQQIFLKLFNTNVIDTVDIDLPNVMI